MKILCAGDFHIGRRSSKIPQNLGEQRFSGAAAWQRVVDRARELRVDVFVVSGDIIDKDNQYFESIGPLEWGLKKLADAGIETFLVAGNHDAAVLPKVADSLSLPRVHLLGRGGQWQRYEVKPDGDPVLYVDGWSFSDEHVTANPLDSYDLAHPGGVPTLGLLHADLDKTESPYAPVQRAELNRPGLVAWVLGHVHTGRVEQEASADKPVIFYTGSPQALDPGEAGEHGVWLLQLEPGQPAKPRFIPTSLVNYRELAIDVTGVKNRDQLDLRITECLRQDLARLATRGGPVEYVSYRLQLLGRTPRGLNVAKHLPDAGTPGPRHEHITSSIEKIDVFTQPEIDIEKLAEGKDFPAVLARTIRQIEKNDDSAEIEALLQSVREAVDDIYQDKHLRNLAIEAKSSTAHIRQLVLQAGYRLLDTLLQDEAET